MEPETAITRAMQRDGADRAAIQSRLDAQLSNEERMRQAQVSIDNNGDEAALTSQLDHHWDERIATGE